MDQLNIIAHDKFQEIVNEARRADSVIQLKTLVLDSDELEKKTVTVVSQPRLAMELGIQPTHPTSSTFVATDKTEPAFTTAAEQKVAQIAYDVIRRLENRPRQIPSVTRLASPDIRAEIIREVSEKYAPLQGGLEGIVQVPDIAAIVEKTTELTINRTIDIPRIVVVPREQVRSGFSSFQLDLSAIYYQPLEEDLWSQEMRTGRLRFIPLGKGGIEEDKLEDYVVSGLVEFDDIAYDQNADLLYDLASQVVKYLRSYLDEQQTKGVLSCYQRDIARLIHSQMQEHYWEDTVEYEVKVIKGFSDLKSRAYTHPVGKDVLDFRQSPPDKSNMSRYLFTGFSRCLYLEEKFDSDSERMLSVVLEREALKWFKPTKGQFQIYYRFGSEHPEYQPDFVAETTDHIAATYQGKAWKYLLIPHDAIAENVTLQGLAERFSIS